MTTALSLLPAERLLLFVEAFCTAVHDCPNRGSAGPLLGLLWRRLVHLGNRLATILARAGKPRRPTAPGQSSPCPTSPPAGPYVPPLAKAPLRSFSAVLHRLPEHSTYRSQLQHLLAQPDMAALLQTMPELGRVLRPLCQLLRIKPPAFPQPPFPQPPNSPQTPVPIAEPATRSTHQPDPSAIPPTRQPTDHTCQNSKHDPPDRAPRNPGPDTPHCHAAPK